MECHPYFQQKALKDFCEKQQIHLEAWSPLSRGAVFQDETIMAIAQKHGKTPAQVVLRWHLQENTIVIPKTVTPARMKENFYVFDFSLDGQDMADIRSIDKNERAGREPNKMDLI